MNEQMEELKLLAMPLVEYLRKNYNPHCAVIVTDVQVKVVADQIGIPVTDDYTG